MATTQHSHKHTHQLGDGNDHPVHEPVEHDHEHEDGPTPDASRHHNYTEEPAVVVTGPITPGQWRLAGPQHGEPMSQDHPGEPDHPAYIFVTRGGHEVVIATVELEANAKLLTFSPALLRFVQSMAAQTEGGITTNQYRERALALIEQLNQVEVRSDANRW